MNVESPQTPLEDHDTSEKKPRIAQGIGKAIIALIHEGVSLPAAAERGGIRLDTLQDAITREHVKAYMAYQNEIAEQVDALIDMAKGRAVKRAAMEILSSDAPPNQKIKAMEFLRDAPNRQPKGAEPEQPELVRHGYDYPKRPDTGSDGAGNQGPDITGEMGDG